MTSVVFTQNGKPISDETVTTLLQMFVTNGCTDGPMMRVRADAWRYNCLAEAAQGAATARMSRIYTRLKNRGIDWIYVPEDTNKE